MLLIIFAADVVIFGRKLKMISPFPINSKAFLKGDKTPDVWTKEHQEVVNQLAANKDEGCDIHEIIDALQEAGLQSPSIELFSTCLWEAVRCGEDPPFGGMIKRLRNGWTKDGEPEEYKKEKA